MGLHFTVDLPAALQAGKVVVFPALWLEAGLASLAIGVVILVLRLQRLPPAADPTALAS